MHRYLMYQLPIAKCYFVQYFYGAMLWDLSGEAAGQVCRSWNTAVKLVWDVPRATHTYLVEHLLGLGLPSIRHKLSCQYVGFIQKLRTSASKEVRILSEIVCRDARCTVCDWKEHHAHHGRVRHGSQVMVSGQVQDEGCEKTCSCG